jgi:Zn-dependent protease
MPRTLVPRCHTDYYSIVTLISFMPFSLIMLISLLPFSHIDYARRLITPLAVATALLSR